MRSWNGLALALLTLWSNDATLTFAQYVTTVTEYVNDNPFCTPVNRIAAPGGSAGVGANGGGAGSSGSGSASGGLNGSSNGTSSATNGRQVHFFLGQDRMGSIILTILAVFQYRPLKLVTEVLKPSVTTLLRQTEIFWVVPYSPAH